MIKPGLWSLDPSRVAPKWGWFWSHAILAFPFREGSGVPVDVVRGARPSALASGWAWEAGHWGMGLRSGGTELAFDDASFPLASDVIPANDFSVVVVVDAVAQSGPVTNLVQSNDWRINWETYNSTEQVGWTKISFADLPFSALPTPPDGTPTVLGFSIFDDNTILGVLDGYRSQVNGNTDPHSTGTLTLGPGGADVRYAGLYFFDRPLTLQEHRDIAVDPSGPFRCQRHGLYPRSTIRRKTKYLGRR